MTVLDSHGTGHVAGSWLAFLDDAWRSGDAARVAALFVEGGHWRDLVGLSWHLHTFTGRAEIEAATADVLPAATAGDVRLRSSPPPRWVQRAGIDTLEVAFDFTTARGRGAGVVRLVEDTDGELRIWTLLTSLRELAGFEELRGDRRPRGASWAHNFGGANWRDERIAAASYADHDPAVLVVGGGQAGLSIAARLGRLGVDTLVVDRIARAGDNWRHRYHSLTLHNETWVNHLPYMPFPDSFPVFIPKDMLANWFEAYVDAMEINFWGSTEFVSAAYDDRTREWRATVRRDGQHRVLHPRHVVMATGVSGLPNVPALPGIDDFAGEVVHSGTYRDGGRYRGRPAVVLGTGNSGHDVAQDLHGHGATVTMVQRSSTTVANAEPTAQKVYALYSEGLPTEDADLILTATPYPVTVRNFQLATAAMRREDADLIAGLESVGFRQDWGHDDTGFLMKYWRRGGGYYLNVGCSELIIDGEIGLIQYDDVERVVADGVRLRDGGLVPADLVVLATGYLSQQELVRRCFGDDVAERVGPIWGYDDEGELANMWKRTAQDGLWFHAGSLAQNRVYSTFLALQITAVEEGLIGPGRPPRPGDRAPAVATPGRADA